MQVKRQQLELDMEQRTGSKLGKEYVKAVCIAVDLGLILGLGRSPGEGNGSPLQYSCLENPMDCGVW